MPSHFRAPVTRRQFVIGGGVGLAGLALSSCVRPFAKSGTTLAPSTPGQVFTEPQLLTSTDGVLRVELTAQAKQLPWGDGTRYALAYNGSVPGPTLRVNPGDRIELTLRNNLDEPTNLHTHGLHVSPEGNSDNILVMVAPGDSRTYTYEVPADHAGGTFWYHPHHHGTVARQISGGMAGAIVVMDADDASTAFTSTTDRVMVISDPRTGRDSSVLDASSMEKMMGREGDVILVNGLRAPVLRVETGRTERWRIVNASASRYYRLGLGGTRFMHVATDQGRFAAPLEVDHVVLTPGQRAEIAVNVTTGMTGLVASPVDRNMMHGMGGGMGGGMMGGGQSTFTSDETIVGFEVVDTGTSTFMPAALHARGSAPAATSSRSLSFGAAGMGMMSNGEFVIDGKAFAAGRVDADPAFGSVEEWTVTNKSGMDHPFHLHVWPFTVVSRSSGAAPDPGWRDTVNIGAGETVVIRIPFTDFGGTTVYHCHILDHEDLGMMGTIRVA